jgi:hypothetical protein
MLSLEPNLEYQALSSASSRKVNRDTHWEQEGRLFFFMFHVEHSAELFLEPNQDPVLLLRAH